MNRDTKHLLDKPAGQVAADLVFVLSRSILELCGEARSKTNCPHAILACAMETALMNAYLCWLKDAGACECDGCAKFTASMRLRMKDTATRIAAMTEIDVANPDKVRLLFDVTDDDGRYVATIPHQDV